MQTNRVPLDDVGGMGIFNLMAKALTVLPWERERMAPAAVSDVRPSRRGLLDRLDDWFWEHKQRALDGYLAQAQDVYDLEARIRDLERGTPYRVR